ncbi:MAG: glycosyltransferase [Spirochaetales bacterium]|nr:glycosyltransferase [Spirochaetales bacterium]
MKKILIGMIILGDGHRAPALALSSFINQHYMGKYEVKVVDLAKELKAGFAYYIYSNSWNKVGLKRPKLSTFIMNFGDNGFVSWLINTFFGMGLKKRLKRFLLKEQPHVFVTTHYFFAHRFGALKRKNGLSIPHVSINTDPFWAHHFWADRFCDSMVVFSGYAKSELVKRGVKRSKIHVFPYPVNPKFEMINDNKVEARKKLGLETDVTTFVMSAGGEGLGVMEGHIKFLIKKELNIQFIIICGRNNKLRERLKKEIVGGKSPPYIHIRGFVDNMEEYIAASDFVVGKAGANFTFEALNLKKPVIHNAWVVNEAGTKDFVVNNGFGFAAGNAYDLHDLLVKIAADNAVIKRCNTNIKEYGIKNGVGKLADFIISHLN